MPPAQHKTLLSSLEELKRPAGAGGLKRLLKVLKHLSRGKFRDADSLIRFHESLLFMRAYPQSAEHLRQTERLLRTFKRRVDELGSTGADLSPFSEPNVSGISGTSFSALFSYETVRDVARLNPRRVSIDWDGYEEYERFAAVLSEFLPLIEENAYVEPRFPFLEWLRLASRPEGELQWLLKRFDQMQRPERERAALFNSLKLWLHWEFTNDAKTRTLMKRRVRKHFYHTGPLISRREVSLERELDGPPLRTEKLSLREGERLLDMGRETMAARYRELHGFTYGDPRSIVRADAGRGLEIFTWGVPPARRLPTLGYTAALILKNGVPHGYAEALSLFERAEVGLNIFYTFREGESAWIYARLLRLLRQLYGVTVFSIDPYQLGFHNEEGIESGAYWFYRKLGFRPVVPELLELIQAEERRISGRKGYRTSAPTLRRLASGHVLYEHGGGRRGVWDRFHLRNLGLAVQRRMGREFRGDAEALRSASVREVSRALKVNPAAWSEAEQKALSDWSLLLAFVRDLSGWSDDERRALVGVIRAKAGRDETRYLRLLLRHKRLREEIIGLGSR